MYRILVCDDEEEIVSSLTACLTAEGYQTVTARTGWEVLDILSKQPIHLALLGTKLPGLDGLTTVTRLRQMHDLPVILLTSGTDSTENILGLTIGADDYITKPFNILEVKARIKAILRRNSKKSRQEPQQTKKVIEAGDLTLDSDSRRVFIASREINLTAKEFDLLELLVCNPGKVYSREELLRFVWGNRAAAGGDVRTVDVHVRRLREKIEPSPSDPKYVHTKWGVGYYFRIR